MCDRKQQRDTDRGRVRQRHSEAFAEVGMHSLVRVLKKNIKNFRKIKKRWKLSEKRTKPKNFEIFEKNVKVEFFKNFRFSALFGQFPAFFDFLISFQNFSKNQKTLEIV
jgi:hypothetical protein